MVLGGSLLEVEGELECVDIAVELGHGVNAALVEQECVVSAVCVGRIVVDHGLVLVGHRHILVYQSPAGRLDASLGSGRGCICVEIVGRGKVGHGDAGAVVGAEFKDDVIDIVATVLASLARGQYVAEGDIVSASGVGGEVDRVQDRCGGACVVDCCHGHEGAGVRKV